MREDLASFRDTLSLLVHSANFISFLFAFELQMPLALPSLSMGMVSLMFLGLIISSRRLNWKNVVFHMRLSPLWVHKVVVCIKSLKVKIGFVWIYLFVYRLISCHSG